MRNMDSHSTIMIMITSTIIAQCFSVWGIMWIPITRYFEYLSTWIYNISLYIRVSYFNIPFVFLNTRKTLIAIFEYHKMCSSKYWTLKWILYHYIRNIPLYVFRNILFWELLYMFSARYLNISLAKKKTTISDSNTLRWLTYILLIVPTVFFLELQSTGSSSTDK